jgi:hypothetical protein
VRRNRTPTTRSRPTEKASRARRILVLGLLAATATVVAPPGPAGAAVSLTATSTGTRVDVVAENTWTITFTCEGGNLTVHGARGVPATVVPTPAVACTDVTRVTVTGDDQAQNVQGHLLDGPAFTAEPSLELHLAGGSDVATETSRDDTIDLGGPGLGTNHLTVRFDSVPNALTQVNGEASFAGTSGDDTMTASGTGTDVTVTRTNSSGTDAASAAGVTTVSMDAGAGTDTVDATGLDPSTPVRANLGCAGDCTLLGGPHQSILGSAVDRTATLTGGLGDDFAYTRSRSDTVDLSAGGADVVTDEHSSRAGGRTLLGAGADDRFISDQTMSDTVARIHPTAAASPAGVVQLVTSLNRPGRQVLPPAMGAVEVVGTTFGNGAHWMADVVATSKAVRIRGDQVGPAYVDLTVPTGSWTTSGALGSEAYVIDPTTPGLGSVTVTGIDSVAVHGPWPDDATSFAHRLLRDLLLALPTAAQRNAVASGIDGSATSRYVASLKVIRSDPYRALDVDRSYRRILDRKADSSGSPYWVAAIRNGRSLRTFRAQLYGSSEFYRHSGSTAAGFVQRAYARVLGRRPDPAGAAYWTAKVAGGAERGSVANQFLATTEARRAIVTDQFLRFLDREPTAGEATDWVQVLGATAAGEQDMITALTTSAAYYARD